MNGHQSALYGSSMPSSPEQQAVPHPLVREVKALGEPTGRSYRKGETIFKPGDVDEAVYYIESGVVKLVHLAPDGRRLTLAICGKDNVFGELALINSPTRQLLAQVLQRAVIHRIDALRFREILAEKPELAFEVMTLFGQRTREIERKLEDLALQEIPVRISRQILQLIDQYGIDTDEGRQINFKITHKELADLVGSARENVTQALNDLAEEGVLDKRRYRIIVKDEARLKAIAGYPAK